MEAKLRIASFGGEGSKRMKPQRTSYSDHRVPVALAMLAAVVALIGSQQPNNTSGHDAVRLAAIGQVSR